MSSRPGLGAGILLTAVGKALCLHGEVNLVLEGRILAPDQQAGVVRDRCAQRLDPVLLGLREVLQHIVLDEIAHAGMPDADADPAELVADMGRDRAQAIVAGGAPPALTRSLPGGRSISSWNTMRSSAPSL